MLTAYTCNIFLCGVFILLRVLCKVLKAAGGEGVMLTQFNQQYYKLMGQALSPSRYGFNTMLELMNKQVETVNLERAANGDWLISLIDSSKVSAANTATTAGR